MDHRVARGGSRIRKAGGTRVTLEQWWNEWSQDTARPACPNPRDHLRLVKSSSETKVEAIHELARLEAENLALRDRAVQLALSIQLLRERAQRQQTG